MRLNWPNRTATRPSSRLEAAAGPHGGFVQRAVPAAGGLSGDYVGGEGADRDIRPNMIVACGLPYKMIDIETQIDRSARCASTCSRRAGCARSAASSALPRRGRYARRARLRHQERFGVAVAPDLSTQARFDIDGDAFLPQAEEMLAAFERRIPELWHRFDRRTLRCGSSFAARGAISQAWSVAAVLEIDRMIRARRPVASSPPSERRAPRRRRCATPAAKRGTAERAASAKRPAARKTAKK